MKNTVIAIAIMGMGVSFAQAQEVVKIGGVAPLTGNISHLGKDLENGSRMALEEANAQGIEIGGKKVKFEFIGEDDQADPRVGTTVAQRLVDQEVKGIVGHLNSGTSIPASRIYDQAGIPMISPASTNPTFTQQGFAGVFRTIANDVQQGSAIGTFSVEKLGAKKLAIIDDRTAYGQGLADETEKAAKAAGAEVVAREFTSNNATDFNAILTKIRAANPDVIFFGGMDAQGGPMLRQLKQLGITAKFITGDGGCSPEMIRLAGDGINENVYCSMPGVPLDKMPGAAAFLERYKARFNADVQVYSPYAYDAANALVKAMQAAGSTDPAKYMPEIKKLNFPGVTGTVSFDEKGDIRGGAVTVYQFKGGDWSAM